MAMTAIEMIEFYGQQVQRTRRGMAAAQSSSNYHLAAMNCRQAFKSRLMQALVSWRLNRDPTDFFLAAVQGFADDWGVLRSLGGEAAKLSDTPAEKLLFVLRLCDQRDLPVVADFNDLDGDRLLDAVLGKWLHGDWEEVLWEKGMAGLRSSGSDLALETYDLYRCLVNASSSDLPVLLKTGESLFRRRNRDEFFSNGDQTEGGGEDNNVTVDYRLAALVKHVGYEGEGVHVWQW